jgi:hypothetical protein
MLFDAEGVLREEVGIERWKLEQIHSFLNERLGEVGWFAKLVAWSQSKRVQKQLPTLALLILSVVMLLANGFLFPDAGIVYEKGDKVVLQGLKKGAEYNGRVGFVMAEDENRRLVIRLAKEAHLEEKGVEGGEKMQKTTGGSSEQATPKEMREGQEEVQHAQQPQHNPDKGKLLRIRPENLRIFDEQGGGQDNEPDSVAEGSK